MMDNTDRLLDLVEEGRIDAEEAVKMMAKWMADADVGEMLDANELSERFDLVEDDDEVEEDLLARYPDAIAQLDVLKREYLGGTV